MRLVPDDGRPEHRVAVYELADGTVGAADYHAFEAFRAGLGDAERQGLHVIWIPARMGLGRAAAVQDELSRTSGRWRMMLALLRHNILAWEGPAFDGPPSKETIDRIPEGEPLVERVLDEIVRRNPARGGPDPKPRGAPGSAAAGAPPSTADSKAESATTTSLFSSPFVSTGRPT